MLSAPLRRAGSRPGRSSSVRLLLVVCGPVGPWGSRCYSAAGESPLGRLGGDRDERADVAHARVVVGGAEVDLDELRRDAGAALREDRRGGRVGTHLGVAVLDEQRGEAREVAARLGDPHRDLGGALERRAQLLVAVALLQLLAAAQRGQRLARRPPHPPGRAAPRGRGTSRPGRSRRRPPASSPCEARATMSHEPRRHRDDDRRGRARLRETAPRRRACRAARRGVRQAGRRPCRDHFLPLRGEALANGVQQEPDPCSNPAPSSVLSGRRSAPRERPDPRERARRCRPDLSARAESPAQP